MDRTILKIDKFYLNVQVFKWKQVYSISVLDFHQWTEQIFNKYWLKSINWVDFYSLNKSIKHMGINLGPKMIDKWIS